ncbi:hypothetical protein [Baekduia sp. Peel2402]|uniref:hypothetical protein n=1 Tax=Baekduia sp. Peel2402 TaxID=3458296 RepID=UPI00403ED386
MTIAVDGRPPLCWIRMTGAGTSVFVSTVRSVVVTSVRLRPGVQPSQVLDQLRPLIMEAGNIVTRGIGVNGVTDMRDAYLMWVEVVEMQLRSVVRDPDFPNALQTARYWHIRELELGSQPVPPTLAGLQRLHGLDGALSVRLAPRLALGLGLGRHEILLG